MNRNKHGCKILASILLFSSTLVAQTSRPNRVSTVFAVLTKSLDAKSATAGQEITLKTIGDVVVDGEIVIPKGSSLLCQITEVATKGKDEPRSMLAIVIEKAVNTKGPEIPLQAIIAAIAAPQDISLASDPTYGMMRSNEPKMSGARPSNTASLGELSAGSKASSTAAVATASIKGMNEPSLLNENSQGAIGYEGLSLSWHLMVPPPVTVIASKGKNVKLEAGTQVLLRMVPPRLAK